jgi:hypothetical protein
MTLIITAAVTGRIIQASDRLASVDAQPWDRTWNKSVVLRTMEALVAVSFTGSAFVGRRPIDQWAVETLSGVELGEGAIAVSAETRRGLRKSIWRLANGLRPHVRRGGFPTLALISGWRLRRGCLRPCHLTMSNDRFPEPGGELIIRSHTRHRLRFGFVDASGWVSSARLARLNDDLALLAGAPSEQDECIIKLIREMSRRAPGSIGPDVMLIEIPRDRPRPRVRFAPDTPAFARFADEGSGESSLMPAFYTPAIVGPGFV